MKRFRSSATALLLMTVVATAALAEERAIVPVAGSIAGALGSNFRTEMQMHNPGTGVMRGTIGEVQDTQIVCDREPANVLEAAFWSLLRTRNFRDCVLKAVNLGGETATVAALAGGLAGVSYGSDGIPPEWIEGIARKEEIVEISNRFAALVCA